MVEQNWDDLNEMTRGKLKAEQDSNLIFWERRNTPSGNPLGDTHYVVRLVEANEPDIDGRDEPFSYIAGYNDWKVLKQFIESEVIGTVTPLDTVMLARMELTKPEKEVGTQFSVEEEIDLEEWTDESIIEAVENLKK